MVITSIRDMINGRALVSTGPAVTVRDACHILSEHNVGALPVIDDGRLAGMFSERDVIWKFICAGRAMEHITVAEIMTPDPQVIEIDRPLSEALTIMSRGGFRHLPVMNAGTLAGMLSIRDIPLDYHLMHARFKEYRKVSA